MKYSLKKRQLIAQTEVILASTGGEAGVTVHEILMLAEFLSMMTNYDDEAIQSGENLLLTFTKIGKEVFPQATETMLDMSAALGQDLKSSALQLGKALNDPIQGITALRRVGVSFTEQQIEQIRVLKDSGNVRVAQKIILAEFNAKFGGTARETVSAITILNKQLGNVAGMLLSALNSAVGGVAKLITTFLKK